MRYNANMRYLDSIPHLHNVPVLVRASLNVPVKNGKVEGGFRLKRAEATISYLVERHARVILIGHLGGLGTETLEPVYEEMKKTFREMRFCPSTIGKEAREAVRALPAGGILMLENLRRHRGELMNDEEFAKELSLLADVFVQDSFDVCHRAHASVVGVPQFLPSYAGLLVEEEVEELQKALKPKKPSLAIIGGAKFLTKEAVLKRLLTKYSRVFVGGALANDFIREMGLPVESSLVSKERAPGIKKLLRNRKLMLPLDEVIAPLGSGRSEGRVEKLDGKAPYEAILDDGPQTVELLERHIYEAKTILWNGPLGNYEHGFTDATEAVARAVARSGAHTIVGGGDTVAAIENVGVMQSLSFVSTGGGAMLEFLAEGTLVGLDALKS
jgi:phosphoglycerate kinase